MQSHQAGRGPPHTGLHHRLVTLLSLLLRGAPGSRKVSDHSQISIKPSLAPTSRLDLDSVVESYYGPPEYDTFDTRKWLREAYREEIESYMRRQEKVEQEEEVTDILTDERPDWSDEDVLLGYMIYKQETDNLQEEEISDILQVIFPRMFDI